MQNQFGMGNRGSIPYGSYPAPIQGSMGPGMMPTQSQRDPMERIPVDQQNRAFMDRKEGIMDRMDDGANWRGSGSIYA